MRDSRNYDSDLSVRVYEQTVNNGDVDVLVKLKETFDSGISQDKKECTFFIGGEEMFTFKSVEERSYSCHSYQSIYLNGEYVESENRKELLSAIGAEKIFETIKGEQLLIKQKADNVESMIKESEVAKQSLKVGGILDKIKSMSENLTEKSIYKSKRM